MEQTKKCPYCGQEILAVAKKCKHCGAWIETNNTRSDNKPTMVSWIDRHGAWLHVIVILAFFLSFVLSINIGPALFVYTLAVSIITLPLHSYLLYRKGRKASGNVADYLRSKSTFLLYCVDIPYFALLLAFAIGVIFDLGAVFIVIALFLIALYVFLWARKRYSAHTKITYDASFNTKKWNWKDLLFAFIGGSVILLICIAFTVDSNSYKKYRIEKELEEMQSKDTEIAKEEAGTPLSSSLINGEYNGKGADATLSLSDGKGHIIYRKGNGTEFSFNYKLRKAIHRQRDLISDKEVRDTAVWMTINDVDVIKGDNPNEIRSGINGAEYRIKKFSEFENFVTLLIFDDIYVKK